MCAEWLWWGWWCREKRFEVADETLEVVDEEDFESANVVVADELDLAELFLVFDELDLTPRLLDVVVVDAFAFEEPAFDLT